MKNKITYTLTLISALMLAGCGNANPQPVITLVPTLALPTAAEITPATAEALPTASSTGMPEPTASPEPPGEEKPIDLPMPEGEPAHEWMGLPVMPGAAAGQGDDEGYMFSIKASVDEVRSYYEEELSALGFSMLAAGEGKSNSLLLFFEKGEETASIAIIDDGRPDGLILILLLR